MSLKIYETNLNGDPISFICDNCHLITYPNYDVCPTCFNVKRKVPLKPIGSKNRRKIKYRKTPINQSTLYGNNLRNVFWGNRKEKVNENG